MTTAEFAIPKNIAEMSARIEDIAEKDEVSEKELKELVYLIWDSQGEGFYGSRMVLPSKENVELSINPAFPEKNQAWIQLYNGPGKTTGETIQLSDIDGEPVWQIGVWGAYHSELLGRDVDIRSPMGDLMASIVPLNVGEMAKVAKLLVEHWGDISEGDAMVPGSLMISYEVERKLTQLRY